MVGTPARLDQRGIGKRYRRSGRWVLRGRGTAAVSLIAAHLREPS